MSSSTPGTQQVDQKELVGGTIRVYEWGFWISLVLIVAGLAVGFVRDESMPESLGSPGHVFSQLAGGHADGIVGVGVLVMILTPLIGVITLAVNFYRAQDLRFGLFTTVIVLILLGSV